MTLNWQNNVARVGGVEFEVWQEDSDWGWNVYLTKRVDVSTCEHMPLLNLDYYNNCCPTKAEARAAAEEIAEAIFKGEEEFRLYEKHADGSTTLENIYYTQEEAEQMALDDPEGYVVLRGVFVPLEGD